MADVMTKIQRSRCMSNIRGTDTKPEIILRKALWANGLRYRLKSTLPGRPDIVFVLARLAVFIDGCFWHSCPQHSTKPKTNAAFWEKKLRENVLRDRRVELELNELGWQVLRFWEHQIKVFQKTIVRIIKKRLTDPPTTYA